VSWHEIPRRLQVRYLHAAAITAAQLSRLTGELEQHGGNRDTLKLMLRRFQGLAAWAGLHGLSTIAVAAQLGEEDCATLAGGCISPQPAHLEQIRALVQVLRQQIYRLRTGGGISEEILWARPVATDREPVAAVCSRPPYRALAVGLQEVDWRHLESLLLKQGFALQAVETCREAGRVFATEPPDAVIAAADLPDGSGTLLTHYLRTQERGDDPVVVLVGDAAAEGPGAPPATEPWPGCDADARFAAPIDWAALAQGLPALRERRRSAPGVLCVASDDEEAAGMGALLRGAGYRVRRCRDPRRFAREVLTSEPELVLIDLPPAGDAAGELLRWLRSDKRCAGVPVILLATETIEDGEALPAPAIDAALTERATKPVAAQSLLSRVAARIEHSRALKHLFAESGRQVSSPAMRAPAAPA
jgi:DNA-binding response OmpR family regulator